MRTSFFRCTTGALLSNYLLWI